MTKIFAAILFIIVTAGCRMSGEEVQTCLNLCEAREGVEHINTSGASNFCKCKNGEWFTIGGND